MTAYLIMEKNQESFDSVGVSFPRIESMKRLGKKSSKESESQTDENGQDMTSSV